MTEPTANAARTTDQRLDAIEGQLARVERGLADLLTGREEEFATLRAVRDGIDVKVNELKRLTAVEEGLDRLVRAILGAVETEVEQAGR